MDKLGPQARALMGHSSSLAVPQELDFLINDLRAPKPDVTVSKVLGYIYHYLPFVKHEHNLRLVVASFLNSPVCFGSVVPSFEDNYLIIEVFKLILDKKLKVSQPTLDIKTFYTVLLKELTHFVDFNPYQNSWKVLPIISGIQLALELRDQLYSKNNFIQYGWFFRDYDSKLRQLFQRAMRYSISPTFDDNVINLSLLSLAVTFKKDDKIEDFTKGISTHFLAQRTFELLYLNHESSNLIYSKFYHFALTPNLDEIIQKEIMQKPVIKHMNKLSFLLEAYFETLDYNNDSYELIMNICLQLQHFNRGLSSSVQKSIFNDPKGSSNPQAPFQHFWFLMKGILFLEVIIFQGILTRFLSSKNRNYLPILQRNQNEVKEAEYKQISLKILNNLYYLNFILLSIGQGGFDNYNFVYYLAIEIALSGGVSFEKFTMHLIGDYNEVNLYADALNKNYVGRSKVLFVLGLWENYLQLGTKNIDFTKGEIYDLCIHLADDAKYSDNDLIEASHSVLLLCFSAQGNIQEYIQYVELLFGQFPSRLSSNQLSIAIETLGKKILSNPIVLHGSRTSADEFLEFLLARTSELKSGIPIKAPSVQTDTFSSAQPIPEIEANSTLRNMGEKKRKENDIIKANKRKKPKDLMRIDLLPPGKVAKDYVFRNRIILETTREAYITSFINVVPYLPLSVFSYWLDNIWELIQESDPEERNFLTSVLWRVLSENLDLNRSELAYRWWYLEKEIPQAPQGVHL
ncbi:uncharacterized protein CANTADRAFT_92193 [Suhomyces tanzawaensis NRRL Y-17324]|uniref:Uncharacterized protein n=1 Tax=Suhomyces tanzawaensis NRRL Y-17324 TaxID=984487 RepID=A0A1E4SC43_9ASCO|nr:uncharacterized protein CANTADRAFT_92193 [Suhomyces tanzawaensis NRRL Y-17324]ODV77048.1 hypothetical protein CANTADRAFT_92193 [Suhomyces tanzawaensis NRRL Y-17324]